MLQHLTLSVILNGGALYLVIYLLDTVDYTGGWLFFVVAGLLIGLLNTAIKPILKALTLPLIIISMGLALIAVNVLIFWLTDAILPYLNFPDVDLIVDGLPGYVVGGTLFGIINWIENLIIPLKKS